MEADRKESNIGYEARQANTPTYQSDFIYGLRTEYTGLNFPQGAATETWDCIFTMNGDVIRREGFDFEDNYALEAVNAAGQSCHTYIWKNAGGDGESIVYVVQIGALLYFYLQTAATVLSPISQHKLTTVLDLALFQVQQDTFEECQFADGNGYLFVYNRLINPVYCIFDPITKVITAAKIDVKIRDFAGIPEPGVDTTHRDLAITTDHEYNLRNQGWTRAALWSFTAFDNNNAYLMGDYPGVPIPQSFTGNGFVGIGPSFGQHIWTIATGEPITVGTPVDITFSIPCNIYDIEAVEWHTGTETGTAKGTVLAYDTVTGDITVNITFTAPLLHADNLEYVSAGEITYTVSSSSSINTIDTWHTLIGNYPANADIWWIFKDQTDTFNPPVTLGNKGLPSAWAPKGHYILNAFSQDRAGVANSLQQYGSTLAGITTIVTQDRPATGTWFQGRVWFTGVDDSQAASGDMPYTTWTENIYFSQIVTQIDDFGHCYQVNDPTDQYSFNLLPSDGGVIVIQGAGRIFKLFPIQNGMLVFAANGIWFITGSQGIGFTANDYTITKISAVRSIAANSFVDVNGLPFFWNEEGIYAVAPANQGLGLTVNPLTVDTIDSFYDDIPYQSKLVARGDYDPINYVIQWLYPADPNAVPELNYNFRLFDESCHLYFSDNVGETWNFGNTPSNTLGDDWSDFQMAINDVDYETMVAFDSHSTPLPLHTAVGVSLTAGQTGSWTLYTPGDIDTAIWVSGALTAHGKIILACPSRIDIPPYISYDGAQTWNPTSLPINNKWARAAFSQNAAIMYVAREDMTSGSIYKSEDLGSTWTQLAFSPPGPSASDGDDMCVLRCSADGQRLVYFIFNSDADEQGLIWISQDAGNSWTSTLLATPGAYFPQVDAVMTPDGNTILAVAQDSSIQVLQPIQPATWNPADTGVDITISEGGLLATKTSGTSDLDSQFRSTLFESSGKFYCEVGITTMTTPFTALGVANAVHSMVEDPTHWPGSADGGQSIGLVSNGHIVFNGLTTTIISGFTQGDTIGIALDINNGNVWFRTINGGGVGDWNNDPTANPTTDTGGIVHGIAGPLAIIGDVVDPGNQMTANFGQAPYQATPPVGFANWATGASGMYWNAADSSTNDTIETNPLTVNKSGTDGFVSHTRATTFANSGKRYFEFVVDFDVRPPGNVAVGVAASTLALDGTAVYAPSDPWTGNADQTSWGWYPTAGIFFNNSNIYGLQFSIGDTISVAMDLDIGALWVRVNNGNWNSDPTVDPAAGTGAIVLGSLAGQSLAPIFEGYKVTDRATANLNGPYAGTVPAGFTNWDGTLPQQVTPNPTRAWLSQDGGSTFIEITSRLPAINTGGVLAGDVWPKVGLVSGVSPDSQAMMIGYGRGATDNIGYADISMDGGNTFSTKFIDETSQVANSSAPGYWTAAYITPTTSTTTKFNRILNHNVHTNAWYPWTISDGTGSPDVKDVKYLMNPGDDTDSVEGMFKYFTILGDTQMTFSDATDETFVDWDYLDELTGFIYNSYFVSGYSLFGLGMHRFQPIYVEMYSRMVDPGTTSQYFIQGLWDFGASGASNRWSTRQRTQITEPNFGMAFRRHKIRGHGMALQLKVSSVDNHPFDIMGWNMQIAEKPGV